MNEEKYYEDSFVSLSAFLCLDNKVQYQDVPSPTVLPNIQYLQKTTCQPVKNQGACFLLQDQMQDEQNQEILLIGAEKKEKKDYSKNFRKKHKEYVENLKMMNEKYERRIEELCLKVQQMAHEIKCLKYGKRISENVFDSMFVIEKEQSLKEMVSEAQNQKETSWDRIKKFDEVYGIAGKQKLNLLNYYMSQIFDNLLIDKYKSLVLNGINNFKPYKPFAQRLHEKQIEIINYDFKQDFQLRKIMKKLMTETLKKFHQSGELFYQSYVHMISQVKEIQIQLKNIEERTCKILPAEGFLNVLKWYEENKFSRDVQLLRKEWFESFVKRQETSKP